MEKLVNVVAGFIRRISFNIEAGYSPNSIFLSFTFERIKRDE